MVEAVDEYLHDHPSLVPDVLQSAYMHTNHERVRRISWPEHNSDCP